MLWMEVGSLRRRPILLIPADLLWPARDRGPDTTPQTRSPGLPKTSPPKQELEGHGPPARSAFTPKFAWIPFSGVGKRYSQNKRPAQTISLQGLESPQSLAVTCARSEVWIRDRQRPSTAIVFDCLPARGKSWLVRQILNTFVWERRTRRCLTEEDGLDENSQRIERIAALIMR